MVPERAGDLVRSHMPRHGTKSKDCPPKSERTVKATDVVQKINEGTDRPQKENTACCSPLPRTQLTVTTKLGTFPRISFIKRGALVGND